MINEPGQTDSKINCAACGAATRVPAYSHQDGNLQELWGCGSQQDGRLYQVYLCNPCFFRTLAHLRERRRIHALFDECPKGDLLFNRADPNDFLGRRSNRFQGHGYDRAYSLAVRFTQ